MLFDSIETVVRLMRRAATSTGLRTTVNVIRRCYETGRNATDEMKQQLQTQHDEHETTHGREVQRFNSA